MAAGLAFFFVAEGVTSSLFCGDRWGRPGMPQRFLKLPPPGTRLVRLRSPTVSVAGRDGGWLRGGARMGLRLLRTELGVDFDFQILLQRSLAIPERDLGSERWLAILSATAHFHASENCRRALCVSSVATCCYAL